MVLNFSVKTKIVVKLDVELVRFLEHFQSRHQIKTRSETLEAAIRELRRVHLRNEYAAAAQDLEYLVDIQVWVNAI
jgi:metal-responsive CopG/Arc/MetJ family transcriptional regulator